MYLEFKNGGCVCHPVVVYGTNAWNLNNGDDYNTVGVICTLHFGYTQNISLQKATRPKKGKGGPHKAHASNVKVRLLTIGLQGVTHKRQTERQTDR